MHDDLGKLPQLDHKNLYFVIWTTTIWTLPGNLAICLNPRESYVVVKAPNGELYIMTVSCELPAYFREVLEKLAERTQAGSSL